MKTTTVQSKAARVLFKELPEDKILITGFENFMIGEEITAKFGENIRDQYFEYNSKVTKKVSLEGFFQLRSCTTTYSVGDVLDKKEFNVLIGSLKQAGKLLHDLVVANKTKTKSITI